MSIYSRIRKKGFTLTELLVVLAIIGLLATIALPTYINRMEQARITTARAECEELAKAEEIVGATYGFFLALQLLDNVPTSRQLTQTNPPDDFQNENLGGLYAIDVSIPIFQQYNNQGSGDLNLVLDQSSGTNTNYRVKNMMDQWGGPFINFHRYYKSNDPNPYPTNQQTIRRDYPLDPWGRPYRFFSPIGIIGARADVSDLDQDGFSNGLLTNTDNENRFDRFAVVSFGPDGYLDNTGTSNIKDDVSYVFGPGETVYNPF